MKSVHGNKSFSEAEKRREARELWNGCFLYLWQMLIAGLWVTWVSFTQTIGLKRRTKPPHHTCTYMCMLCASTVLLCVCLPLCPIFCGFRGGPRPLLSPLALALLKVRRGKRFLLSFFSFFPLLIPSFPHTSGSGACCVPFARRRLTESHTFSLAIDSGDPPIVPPGKRRRS